MCNDFESRTLDKLVTLATDQEARLHDLKAELSELDAEGLLARTAELGDTVARIEAGLRALIDGYTVGPFFATTTARSILNGEEVTLPAREE